MADKKSLCREILKGIIKQVEGDFPCDQTTVDHLRVVQKYFAQSQNQEKREGKRKRIDLETKTIRVHAAFAIWNKVLYRYSTSAPAELFGFERAFTMNGEAGYKKFIGEIKASAFQSLEEEKSLSKEDVLAYKTDFQKPDGWLLNIANNLALNIWDYLLANLSKSEADSLGPVSFRPQKRELLVEWSKQLKVARNSTNVKYGSKVVQVGDVSIAPKNRDTRPSRAIPNVRCLYFLEPNQVKEGEVLGSGIQGEVMTCHILEHPIIPKNSVLVAKRFFEGSKDKRRASALQEVLMGGLNHRGLVGALGMTIEDPPRLVYDRYNGGDLRHFIDKCEAFAKSKGKSLADDNYKFVYEKKMFLQNRLGIAMALLETMHFLHSMDRVHCDLHEANVLLHFDYFDDQATKVYVGMCDFGLSKQLSQCRQEEHRIWKTPDDKVAKFREKFPHMAPELCNMNPAPYSKATDVYALGNMFETLLQAKDCWDDMSYSTRVLQEGWFKVPNNPYRLDGIIQDMMHFDPKKRLDCHHWIQKISKAFPDCRLQTQNSVYLRD